MNQVKLDSAEIKNVLNYIVTNNQYIQEKNKIPVATEITGESGLGKTSVLLQLAQEHNLDLVKLNLAQIEELGDLVGFPIRQFELKSPGKSVSKIEIIDGKRVMKKTTDGLQKTEWIDEIAVKQYTDRGYMFTGNKRMSYCPPDWISGKQNGGILLLDDWNRADIRFIQAVMELIDRQEYISWKLPKNWHIVLSANPDNGDYLVNNIDIAQKTRFMRIVMKWNHERWAEWAEENDIDTRCINFILMHPEVITQQVNPRSITTFFNCISSLDDFNQHLPLIQNLGEGSIGPEASLLFTTFIHNNMDKMITPKDILFNIDYKDVIEQMKAIFKTGNDYRADLASIISIRIINYALVYAKEHSVTPELIERLINLIKESSLFTNDLKYHIVKKIINGNKIKFQKMLIDTEVQELATK